MNFMQKVYYNDKPLVLCTDKDSYLQHHPEAAAYDTCSGATHEIFLAAMDKLEKTETSGVIIDSSSGAELLTQLHGLYRIIDAGGGVTYNEEGAILMIFRRGKWDLPKGKLDEGETIEACAVREVSEETGLENIILNEKIGNTYHVYSQGNEQLLKRTAWYKMKGSSAQKLTPQKAENILEVRWVKENELAPLAAKSYEAIREILTAAGLHW
jgi:8-oxo-dGTP pyrophosphatase MutT (NUDIX family)